MSTSGGALPVETITAGSGITVTDPSGPDATVTALAATYAAGNIPADVSVAATTQTVVMTTAALDVGTWRVDWNVTAANDGSTAADIEATIVAGSATLTANEGTQASENELPAVTDGATVLGGSSLIVVSAAGTLVVIVNAAAACTVKALTPIGTFGGCTGYVAQRIA